MKKMKKVYSFNTELYKVTGVQKVLVDIHQAIKSEYNSLIIGTIPYEEVNENHRIERNEYTQVKNPFMFYNSIVILHERKMLLFFWLLNHLLFQRIKLVYVHHNIFHNHKLLSIMPKTVVSISDRSTENLINYFKVPTLNIHKISNCVVDVCAGRNKFNSSGKITILYPARINYVKRQKDIYQHLKGKLDKNITIFFAGIGPEYQNLVEMIGDDTQFQCLGFIKDIPEFLQRCDYMMLFSRKEGLPITLIEAAMCHVPIICNDVGGNCEVAHDSENAFIVNDWENLVALLNRLPRMEEKQYQRLAMNSRKIYEENFTFEVFKEKYIKLLSSL